MRARTPRAIRRRGPVAPRIPPNLSRHTQARPPAISTDPHTIPTPIYRPVPGGPKKGGPGGGPGNRPGGKKISNRPDWESY